MTRLGPQDMPPQFILFSFDGFGVSENWDMFLHTANKSEARFTALMTGVYFLTDKNKTHYQGPGYKPDESSLAFGGTENEVIEQVEYLNRTWYDGHEMGTHYVGHFCAGTKNPGKDWSTAEWNHELDQFFKLMSDWKQINDITDAPDLAFGTEVVEGGRTLCLEGGMGEPFPALGAHDMTWDSSKPERQPGIYWPIKVGSIWEFPVPYTWSPPLQHRQTAQDYNYWYIFNEAKDAPSQAPKIRTIVKQSYEYMFERLSRKPGAASMTGAGTPSTRPLLTSWHRPALFPTPSAPPTRTSSTGWNCKSLVSCSGGGTWHRSPSMLPNNALPVPDSPLDHRG